MLVSDYNYDLPEDRIAKFPPKERGSTRLLVLDRTTGALQDSHYRDLVDFLNPGDVLVLNDTRVIKSRLFCELPDGRKRELVVLEKHASEPQRVMYHGKLHNGDQLTIHPRAASLAPVATGLARSSSRCRAPDSLGSNSKLVTITKILGNGVAEVESEIPLSELAEKYGTVPLPPYLHRDATAADKQRYQTVWAKNMGSAAAPTASLNMTKELLARLQKKGVIIKYLTLHVGLGTFLPMRTDKVEDHKMHSEWFNIPEDTIEAIQRCGSWSNTSFSGRSSRPSSRGSSLSPRSSCGFPSKEVSRPPAPRIIALGTTVARTLEYYAKTGQTSGEDDIFIYPGFEFKLVDALITNFHAPKSTVLMLASAFAGWDNLKNAYEHAISEKYNFLSYGDSMLIC
ncbi:S-adenosylmethionine:tRNA ribosyltransferase-isomerase [Candidatus Saccharibacteria bacterium]|nr:S-adenosylmethionine:tRNA ribosyltransferase-isomerase [Candidatus Saccharibacteria bacterium]